MSKLADHNRYFDWIDLPYLGLDGFFALVWAVAVAVVPVSIVWWFALDRAPSMSSTRASTNESDVAVRRLFFWAWVLPIAAVAAFVLAVDAHDVRLRYVTPLMMAFPAWIGLVWPLGDKAVAAHRIMKAGACLAVVTAIAWPISVMTVRGPLNYPYREMTEVIAATVEPPFALLGGNEVGSERGGTNARDDRLESHEPR